MCELDRNGIKRCYDHADCIDPQPFGPHFSLHELHLMTFSPRLSIRESLPFLPSFLDGLLNVGLIQPLEAYAAANAGPLATALTDCARRMRDGEAPQVAITAMQPPLAAAIERVLVLGIETGALDRAVQDLIAFSESDAQSEHDLLIGASAVVDAWENRPESAVVCGGCVERELRRLIARATVEGADDVTISMVDGLWMQQDFVGAKLVRIREPSSPHAVDAIFKALRHAADTETEIATGTASCRVTVHDAGLVLEPADTESGVVLVRFRVE